MAGMAWTCEGCGQKLRGHWAHCGVCCLTFSGTAGFDEHLVSLVDAGCRTEPEMANLVNKETGKARLSWREIDGVKVWQTYSEVPSSGPDGSKSEVFKARMATARAAGRTAQK